MDLPVRSLRSTLKDKAGTIWNRLIRATTRTTAENSEGKMQSLKD
jgi:hypothetical protein